MKVIISEEIKELENNLGYAELLDYSGYIGDAIPELADSFIDIYEATLFEKVPDLYADGWLEEAKANFGEFEDIIAWLQLGQYCKISSEIYDELDEIILLGILRELEELGLEEIDEEYISHKIDNNSRFTEIEEVAQEIYEEYTEDIKYYEDESIED